MPNPTASDVHVNRPLTNISIAYTQDASTFVADKVFPNIPVAKQSAISGRAMKPPSEYPRRSTFSRIGDDGA